MAPSSPETLIRFTLQWFFLAKQRSSQRDRRRQVTIVNVNHTLVGGAAFAEFDLRCK